MMREYPNTIEKIDRPLLRDVFHSLETHNYSLSSDQIEQYIIDILKFNESYGVKVMVPSEISQVGGLQKLLFLLLKSALLIPKPELASCIVLSVIKFLSESTTQNEIHPLLTIIRPYILDEIIDRYLVSQRFKHKNLQTIFKLASEYSLLVTRINNENRLPRIPAFRFSLGQVSKIIQLLTSELSSSNETRPELIKEYNLSAVKELGYSLTLLEPSETSRSDEAKYYSVLSGYLSFCYAQIDQMLGKDTASVYIIWNIISPFHTTLYDPKMNFSDKKVLSGYYYFEVASSIIREFTKNHRYRCFIPDIIKALPINAVRIFPQLMITLLEYCADVNNFELGDLLIAQFSKAELFEEIGLEDRPKMLSSLLKLSLAQGDFEKVKQIMDFAKTNYVTLTKNDFKEIVSSSLKTNPKSVWDLILQTEPRIAAPACITYLNYMISSRVIDFSKVEHIYDMAIRALPSNDPFFYFFNSLYCKYLISKFPLQVVMNVYDDSLLNRKQKTFKTLESYNYHQNPFLTRCEKVHLSKLYDSNKVAIVRNIYCTAYKKCQKAGSPEEYNEATSELKFVTAWVVIRLRDLGFTYQSIKVDLINLISKDRTTFAESEGKQNANLETTFTESSRLFEEKWSTIRRGPIPLYKDKTVM
ncbi:unnamed protein product [Ambrosiozyma monospora]|uniref:Unnamed protein product n=1 Tax=Ambrosiozyma monospora TaxID=43982 RepID=A0A9W6YWJ0_AMBMO|nr:unnamed protein product [Ambrosiozyma monospora]